MAHQFGGVDSFLNHVRRAAVEQAAPGLMRTGAVRAAPVIIGGTLFAGAALLVGAVEVESRIKQARDRRRVVRPDAQISRMILGS